jgi:hypothetical protein
MHIIKRVLKISKRGFYAPWTNFGGVYCRCCVRPSVRPLISPKRLVRNGCCWQQMFCETRACGSSPLMVSLKSLRSLGAYKRIQFQHFFIYEVHIASEIHYNWTDTLLATKVTQGHFLRGVGHSVHVPYLWKKKSFQSFKQVFDHTLSCQYHVNVFQTMVSQSKAKVI